MLGFVGLGDMGRPMVEQLLRSGHQVLVWNRTPRKCQELAKWGAMVAESLSELSASCTLVGLCLSSHGAVRSVCCGPAGLLSQPGKLRTVVDFSTGSPHAAMEFARHAGEVGVDWLDAPVSGGPLAAASGTLTVMAGGSAAALESAAPLLKSVARNVTHMGPSGSGQITKLCNQLIVASNVMAIAEATALARKAGVDVEVLTQALEGGFADSRPLQIFGPRMAAHQFEPRLGALELMAKDVCLGDELANGLGLEQPLLQALKERFSQAMNSPRITPSGDLSQAVLLYETGVIG